MRQPTVSAFDTSHRECLDQRSYPETRDRYQFYFHYARRRFPDSVHIRQLYWANGPGPRAVVMCGVDGWPADSQLLRVLRGSAAAKPHLRRRGKEEQQRREARTWR